MFILIRWLVLLLLVGVALSFVLYAITGKQKYKTHGVRVLKWTLVAAFVFFGVLIVERL